MSMLSQLRVQLPAGTSLQLKNIAAVMVTAVLPPFSRQGSVIDITVSSMAAPRACAAARC